MTRILRNIIMGATVCALFLLQSCYKDKGNYDYSDIGQIVIEQPDDIVESSAYQLVMQDNQLYIEPILKLIGVSEDDLDFLWDVAPQNTTNPQFKELSREKILDVNCSITANKYDLRLRVTDRNTGVSAYAYYSLIVNSVTARCLLLLCKAGDNEFDISSCPKDATRGEVGRDLYSKRNGNTLKDMKKLVYWNNIHGEQFLWGLQENGGVTLSPFDLTFHGTADDWFFEKPEVIRPTNIYGDTDGNDYFFLSDGGVYYLDNELAPPFKARARAQVNDGKDYYITQAACTIDSYKNRVYIFWDELNERFLIWENTNKELTGINDDWAFNPNNMEGYTPLFLGSGTTGKSYSFFLGQDGKVHLFQFIYNKSWGGLFTEKHTVVDASIGLEKADCIWTHRAFDMVYYAIDNVIYVYELTSPTQAHRPIYTDPDPNMRFTELYSYDAYESRLYAAGNSEGKGYVYRLYLESSGDLQAPTDYQKEVVEKVGPFGEIVDMEYLLKDY